MDNASRNTEHTIGALDRFFSEFRARSNLPESKKHILSSLEHFFAEFAQLKPALQKDQEMAAPTIILPDFGRLKTFTETFGRIAEESTRLGDFINVWEIAGLKQHELRTAAILAWLFDAKQTHGRRSEILFAFLRRLAQRHQGKFPVPTKAFGNYAVLTEAYSLDNMESRVDIEIEGNCVVIIEVKIGAVAGERQIQNYLELAKAKAATTVTDRPYCVILLATEKQPRLLIESPNFIVATWHDVSAAIDEVIMGGNLTVVSFADRVLKQFARYVNQF